MKAALIGTGRWGNILKKYIPEYFNLKYVADSKFNKDIIWKSDVEVVFIATPVETHFDVAVDAILHRKHVFIEKPITPKKAQADSLKQLAIDKEVSIVIDYTETFSPSLQIIMHQINSGLVGDIENIEITIKKKDNRNVGFDVYHMLGSHGLSMLSMFTPLQNHKFTFSDYIKRKDICTTGVIEFENGKIDVSLDSPIKERSIILQGSTGHVKYTSSQVTINDRHYQVVDGNDNLLHTVKYFRDVIEGKAESNIDMACQITNILERKV